MSVLCPGLCGPQGALLRAAALALVSPRHSTLVSALGGDAPGLWGPGDQWRKKVLMDTDVGGSYVSWKCDLLCHSRAHASVALSDLAPTVGLNLTSALWTDNRNSFNARHHVSASIGRTSSPSMLQRSSITYSWSLISLVRFSMVETPIS